MSENIFQILPTEIVEVVFNFLSVKDILQLSLTCKLLHEVIGNSRNCMNRFWIKFYTFKMKDLECLANSERNYEKLKVNRVKENKDFDFLHQLSMPWSKMLIYNCEIKQFPQFSNILANCSDTIEELELSDIQILNNEYEILPINFTRLQRVMFRNVPSTVIELFLGNNPKLRNISFDIAQDVITGKRSLSDVIRPFLMETRSLKHLQLGPHYIKCLFDEELEKLFEFNLEKLMLKFSIIPDSNELMEENICRFLVNQPRLDWIVVWELNSDQILSTIWNNHPTISHITFIGLEELFDSLDLRLEINPKIVHLELLCRKILLSHIRKILKAAPHLTILHVFKLTKYILDCVVKSDTIIREIRYETIDEDVEEFYKKLKASEDEINSKIALQQASFWRDAAGPFMVDPHFWHS